MCAILESWRQVGFLQFKSINVDKSTCSPGTAFLFFTVNFSSRKVLRDHKCRRDLRKMGDADCQWSAWVLVDSQIPNTSWVLLTVWGAEVTALMGVKTHQRPLPLPLASSIWLCYLFLLILGRRPSLEGRSVSIPIHVGRSWHIHPRLHHVGWQWKPAYPCVSCAGPSMKSLPVSWGLCHTETGASTDLVFQMR
jgi:hypothetical protein